MEEEIESQKDFHQLSAGIHPITDLAIRPIPILRAIRTEMHSNPYR